MKTNILIVLLALISIQITSAQNVLSWKDKVNVTILNNKITKSSGSNAWGDSGAASIERLGENENGWVRTTVVETNKPRMIGLSESNVDASHSTIDFAIYLRHTGVVQVFEGGIKEFDVPVTYQSGDILEVNREDGLITYKINGSVFYTSSKTSTSSLLVDVALHSLNSTLNNILVSTSFFTEHEGNLWSSNAQDIFYSDGNVGIGTSQPDELLTVNGVIHTKEVRVDLSVPAPDYVFKEEYELRTLEDLKEFINQYSHLPEVPSADQMEKDGVNLGEMNMILLKKIEELTLYAIRQEKEMEEMKLEIENLKKEK